MMISIITPVLNGERYIRDCVNCVKNQTYKDVDHIIMVSEDTTDKTLKILEELEYDKLQVIVMDGYGHTRMHRAACLTNSKYVTFLMVDDLLNENFCQKMLISSITNNADITYSNYKMVYYDKNYKEIDSHLGTPLPYRGLDKVIENMHFGVFYLIKRDAWNRIGGLSYPDNRNDIAWDYYLMLMAAHNNCEFYYNPEVLATFRVHPESDTGKSNKIARETEVGDATRKYFLNKVKELE